MGGAEGAGRVRLRDGGAAGKMAGGRMAGDERPTITDRARALAGAEARRLRLSWTECGTAGGFHASRLNRKLVALHQIIISSLLARK